MSTLGPDMQLPTLSDGYVRVASSYSAIGRESWLHKYLRYHRLAVGICALSLCLGMLYIALSERLYVARATIQINSYDPVLKSTRVEEAMQERSKEATYLETQLQEIGSLSLADKVLTSTPGLDQVFRDRAMGLAGRILGRELDRPASSYKHPTSVLEQYLKALSVAPVRRSSTVVVEATSPDPSHAATMANAHVAGYVAWLKSARVEQQSQGLAFLERQAEGLRRRVSDLEREMAEYAESHSIVAVNKDENITVQRMSQLNKLLTDVTAKRIDAEHEADQLEQTLDRDNAGSDDVAIQRIREELARRQAEYQELSAKFTPKYPRLVQLASEIQQLRRSIVDQRRGVLEGLRAKAQAARNEEVKLKLELENQKSLAFELSRGEVQFNSLARDLESSRELLQSVLKQINETGLLLQSSATNVTVLDYATPPSRARYPRIWLVLFGALATGLTVSGVAISLLSKLDDSVRLPEEIAPMCGLPCIGAIPRFVCRTERPLLGQANTTPPPTQPECSPSPLQVAALQDTGAPVAEAYRALRTAIRLSRAGGAPRVIVVTSARAGEGKTVTALNLAGVLASSGSRVVVIDGDLRRPSISRYASLPPSLRGLSEVLAGQAVWSEVIAAGGYPNLSILPSGACPPNPAELLGSEDMRMLLADLQSAFDVIIVDTPPILPVTDGELLAAHADGTVFVVRSGATPRGALKAARARLDMVGARMLGVVVNDLDPNQPGYYRSAYAGYSSYRTQRAA